MVGKRLGRTIQVRKADLPAIRAFIESTHIDKIDDGVRKIIEREMPDLVHKLPPRQDTKPRVTAFKPRSGRARPGPGR